jgi:hypothetical protein
MIPIGTSFELHQQAFSTSIVLEPEGVPAHVIFLTGFWWSVIPLVGWGVVLALHHLNLRRIERADADQRAPRRQHAATAKPAA